MDKSSASEYIVDDHHQDQINYIKYSMINIKKLKLVKSFLRQHFKKDDTIEYLSRKYTFG